MIYNYFLIFITCVHSFSNHVLTFGNQNINKLYACIFSRMLKCLKNASKRVHTSSSLQIEFDDITIFKWKSKQTYMHSFFGNQLTRVPNTTLTILKTVKWHLHVRNYKARKSFSSRLFIIVFILLLEILSNFENKFIWCM